MTRLQEDWEDYLYWDEKIKRGARRARDTSYSRFMADMEEG